MKKYFAIPKEHKLDLQSYFGQHKNYFLFLLKSDTVPVRMAAQMGDLFRLPFRFLEQIKLPVCGKECVFPLFFSRFSYQNEADLILMPNKSTLSAEDVSETSDPLLGLSLFDEDAYIFNRHGRFNFPCEWTDYDYLLFLSAEKDSRACELVLDVLKETRFQDISAMIQPKDNRKAERERVSFLQRLVIDFDVMVSGFLESYVCGKLGAVLSIPDDNHLYRRQGADVVAVSLQPLLDTPLMRRPDY